MDANRGVGRMAGVALAAMAAWGLSAGCEAVTQYDSSILVDPPSVTLTNVNATAVFVAKVQAPMGDTTSSTNQALFLPLVWTVSDASLGTIRASGALTAIYERKAAKEANNYIAVRDQGQAQGVAVVNQPAIPDAPGTNSITNVVSVVVTNRP